MCANIRLEINAKTVELAASSQCVTVMEYLGT